MNEPPLEKDCKHFIPLPFPAAPLGKCAKGHFHTWDGQHVGNDGKWWGNYSATCKGCVKHCFEPKEKEQTKGKKR